VNEDLEEEQALTWENVIPHLEPACQGAISYVDAISRTQQQPQPPEQP
jgi:hypothetical protein